MVTEVEMTVWIQSVWSCETWWRMAMDEFKQQRTTITVSIQLQVAQLWQIPSDACFTSIRKIVKIAFLSHWRLDLCKSIILLSSRTGLPRGHHLEVLLKTFLRRCFGTR